MGALGESWAAAVLEHKFCLGFQVSARVDVTDGGRPTFPQSTHQCPADGFIFVEIIATQLSTAVGT